MFRVAGDVHGLMLSSITGIAPSKPCPKAGIEQVRRGAGKLPHWIAGVNYLTVTAIYRRKEEEKIYY